MTGKQETEGKQMDERVWELDAEGKRLWDSRDPSDCWNIADLQMDREALADYLRAMEQRVAEAERERDNCKGNYELLMMAAKAAEAKAQRYREALEQVMGVGHNNDCLLCGFKDKAVQDALADAAETGAYQSEPEPDARKATAMTDTNQPQTWRKASNVSRQEELQHGIHHRWRVVTEKGEVIADWILEEHADTIIADHAAANKLADAEAERDEAVRLLRLLNIGHRSRHDPETEGFLTYHDLPELKPQNAKLAEAEALLDDMTTTDQARKRLWSIKHLRVLERTLRDALAEIDKLERRVEDGYEERAGIKESLREYIESFKLEAADNIALKNQLQDVLADRDALAAALEANERRLQGLAGVVDAESLSGEELFTKLGDLLHNALVANHAALTAWREAKAKR